DGSVLAAGPGPGAGMCPGGYTSLSGGSTFDLCSGPVRARASGAGRGGALGLFLHAEKGLGGRPTLDAAGLQATPAVLAPVEGDDGARGQAGAHASVLVGARPAVQRLVQPVESRAAARGDGAVDP